MLKFVSYILARIGDVWYQFKLVELTEIMRQKGDTKFIELLNNIWVGNVGSYADDILKTRSLQQPEKLYHFDALHIYA